MLSSEVSSTGSPHIKESIRIRKTTPSITSTNASEGNVGMESLPIVEICDEVTNDSMKLTAPQKHIMANDILNDILETAMDIAVGVETPIKLKRSKMNIIDDDRYRVEDQLNDVSNGLEKVESVPLNEAISAEVDIGMKKMLNNMLVVASPPQPDKNLGIGDSVVADEPQAILVKPSKPLEKKTRITDLVMNSKKVLKSMLSEEQRRKRDEWEETNEQFIQLIELDSNQPELDILTPEACPLPADEGDDELLLMPKDTSQLDNIELCTDDSAVGNSLGGKGDEKKSKESSKSTLHRKGSLCSDGSKRRKWLAGLKVFSFFRNRKNGKGKGDKTEEIPGEHVSH